MSEEKIDKLVDVLEDIPKKLIATIDKNTEKIKALEKNEAYNCEHLEAVSDNIQNHFDRIGALEQKQTEMKLAHDTWWVDLGNSIKEKIPELEQRLLTFEALYTDIDHKRLGALEKRVKDLEDMQETIVETDPVRMESRLEALEKKYELNKENIPKTIHKYYNKNKEKIAELKDAGSARQTEEPTMTGIEVWCPTCNTRTIHTWKYEDKILVAREDLERWTKELFDIDKEFGVAEEMKEKYLKEEEDAP